MTDDRETPLIGTPNPARQSAAAAGVLFPPGGSRFAFEAEASSASSPLAAAFLLGMLVPKKYAARLADVIMSGSVVVPIEGIRGDDGSCAWEWGAEEVFILLRAFDDGRSDAYCHALKTADIDG